MGLLQYIHKLVWQDRKDQALNLDKRRSVSYASVTIKFERVHSTDEIHLAFPSLEYAVGHCDTKHNVQILPSEPGAGGPALA